MRFIMFTKKIAILISFLLFSLTLANNNESFYDYRWIDVDGKKVYAYGIFKVDDEGEVKIVTIVEIIPE